MYKIVVYIFKKQSLLTLSETASRFCVQLAFNYDMWHLYKLQIDLPQ